MHNTDIVKKFVKRRTSYGWFYPFRGDFSNICSEATVELRNLGFKERHLSERSTVHRVFELGGPDNFDAQGNQDRRLSDLMN